MLCHHSGNNISFYFVFLFFSESITLTTTTSSLSSCLVPSCWRSLQEHSWASTSVVARLHSLESSYPRCLSALLYMCGKYFLACHNFDLCVRWQVVPDSDAHRAGLQEGDQVLSVNDVDFQDIEHSRVSCKPKCIYTLCTSVVAYLDSCITGCQSSPPHHQALWLSLYLKQVCRNGETSRAHMAGQDRTDFC